ncbi:MAG: type II secretion system F family protein [Dinoroseobacter sp.]|nr:type II secretion system F family protein [Dinoroseobacter sp.]
MADLIAKIQAFGLTEQTLVLFALGLGVFIAVVGVSSVFAGPSAEARRMKAIAVPSVGAGSNGLLVRPKERDPEGLLKAFIPSSKKERSRTALKLKRAGLYNPDGVWNYYLARSLLAIGLPLAFIATIYAPASIQGWLPLPDAVLQLTFAQQLKIAAALAFVGFYGPTIWLHRRVKARKTAIEHGLPNALDLLQVAVEAGLGFDTAMDRVSRELVEVSPALAQEFAIIQMEVNAGKDRDRAFIDMAERTGVEEMASFTHVVLQSQQFGTSVGEALATYAEEMRMARELRAQERANKLPVQMSGVMAALMMPTLFMITLTPVVIRWLDVFGD